MADIQFTSTTTPESITSEMQTYYEKVFLERAQLALKYDVLCVSKTVPENSGKVVYFTRQTTFTPLTAALSEPTTYASRDAYTGTGFSASTISATLAPYGYMERIGTFFAKTTIDAGLKEKVATMGQHAGESLDTMIRNGIYNGLGATLTTKDADMRQFAGDARDFSANQWTSVTSTCTLNIDELRRAVRFLKRNKAPLWENGMYRAVVPTQGIYELQGDTTTGANWANTNIYNTGENAELVKKGVIGRLAGIDIFESNNEKIDASGESGIDVYHTFVAGKGAFGVVDLAGQGKPKIIHKVPGANSTDNGLNMYETLAWKIEGWAFATLNPAFAIDIIHA
jgi:N4-gp56 family major capsid protein